MTNQPKGYDGRYGDACPDCGAVQSLEVEYDATVTATAHVYFEDGEPLIDILTWDEVDPFFRSHTLRCDKCGASWEVSL